MTGSPEMISPDEQIADAFNAVHKSLDPLTVGDGDTDIVREARLGMQALHLLRQWARRGPPAPMPCPKPPKKRGKR